MSRILLAAAMVSVSASWAWSAVTLSWTDANGPHTVNLTNIAVPTGDPLSAEYEYMWFGVCDVAMSSYPIQFNVTGNFIGELGLVWPVVRIEQNVTNLTGSSWSEFWIEIVGEDGEIYSVVEMEPWNYSSDLSYVKMWTTDPGLYIGPGEVFDDTLNYWAIIPDEEVGDGTLTLTKRPVLIPEAGSGAALLSGVLGALACYKKRRRD